MNINEVYKPTEEVQHYIDQINKLVNGRVSARVLFSVNITADNLLQIISDELNIPVEAIIETGRDGLRRMAARHIFSYIASEYCGWKHEYISAKLKRTRTTITASVNQVQRLLDTKDFIIEPAVNRVVKKILYED